MANGMTVYVLAAVARSELLPVADRFEAAGYEVEIDQDEVLRAIDSIVPGSVRNEAWVVIKTTEMDASSLHLTAAGRLQGLRTVDSSLIVYRVKVNHNDRPLLVRSLDAEADVLQSEFASFVPGAISYIATKLGERSALIENKREVIDNVDRSLEVHIAPVLANLSRTQSQLRWASFAFYSIALTALCTGLYLAAVRAQQIHSTPPKSWVEVAGSAISGLIVIGMLSAVARLAFVLGRSFMVESLTNGDRAHAISFGRFYLQVFREKIDWAEIKEAFQNWNTDRGSSFSAQNATDVDPIVLQMAVEAAKVVAGKTRG